jgi:hypothetical protein
LTYHPVKELGASAAGPVCQFVTSAARTAPKEDAKTAQVETQARNKLAGLLGAAMATFPIRIGMGSALSSKHDVANKRFAEGRKYPPIMKETGP